MNTDTAVELVRGAVMISLLIGAPTLAASMVVGLVITSSVWADTLIPPPPYAYRGARQGSQQ